jgi:glc operon protein GlcG
MAITLEEALTMLQAARKKADSMNVKLSFCIVDARGDLVLAARMDGARHYTVDVARGKAIVSASFGQPSGAVAERAAQGVTLQSLNEVAFQGKLMFAQGAVPIVRNGQLEGAIAGSGAQSAQDEECARVGAAAIGA